MRKASAYIGSAKIFASGTAVLINIIIARNLTISEYGIFSQYVAYLNYLGLIFTFGLNVSHIYHYQHGINLFKKISAFYFFSSLLFIALSIIFENIYLLVIGGAFSISAVSIINSDAQAKNHHLTYTLQVISQNIILALIISGAIYILKQEKGQSIIFYYALSTAIYFVFSIAIIYRKLEPTFGKIQLSYLKYGAKNFGLNLMGQLLYTGDIFIISLMLTKKDVAIYSVASLIAKGMWLAIDAVGMVVFPSLIKITPSERIIKIKESIKVSALICLIPAGIFFIFGKIITVTFFGNEYLPSLTSAYILILASFPLILYKIGSRLAAATQHWKVIYTVLGGGIIINLILNIILIPIIGIEGSAAASLIAYTATGIALILKINVISYDSKKSVT